MTASDQVREVLAPYLGQLQRQARRKALLRGATAGFAAFALSSALARAMGLTGVLPPLIAAILCAAAVGLAAWRRLKPTERSAARHVDSMGLSDRATTMLDLRGDASDIAQLQREDTVNRIAAVSPDALRQPLGRKPILLCLAAALLAAGSLFAPRGWLAAGRAIALPEAVYATLDEERQSLASQDEKALEQQMRDLIDDLNRAASELAAAAMISEAQETAQETAEAGEASEEAAQEMREALASALQQLTDTEADQETEDGVVPVLNPEVREEQRRAAGPEAPDDLVTGADGLSRQPGRGGAGGNAAAAAMTEPIYDPISGHVPYGDVISAYYADFLRLADQDKLPADAAEAASDYFIDLNR